MPSRLEELADALAKAGPSESPEAVSRRAGFSAEEVAQLCQSPDASRAMLNAGVRTHLVPMLPRLIQQIVKRAASGDQSAEKVLLGFLAESSPVQEHLGDALRQASAAALKQMARQAQADLANALKEGE